ncbi:MAG TPA: caspase family protein [Candidatus Angelobacter sp.]|nr:caspase family protein [Candidatus Angelobacter sp.]
MTPCNSRRALIVGINDYNPRCFRPLKGCVPDAQEMAKVLSRNSDQSLNFDCKLLTSADGPPITRGFLRRQWRDLFHNFKEDILFYFSGHGVLTEVGGYLVTQDGEPDDPGLPMEQVVTMANSCAARTVLLILDCCFSGSAGNPASLQPGSIGNWTVLREGVTILAASGSTELSLETGGHGVFTRLVLNALGGGAADVRGYVSAASIYAYVDAALGAWNQHPLYKSHAAFLNPIRLCEPKVPDSLLRELPEYFSRPDRQYQLDKTYERTSGVAIEAHVEIFRKFKKLQVGGLLKPTTGDDLYWTADSSGYVILTDLGRFYLQLVNDRRI